MDSRRFHYYDLLVHIFVVILLISNLVGQKVTAIGWFRISGAQVFFPITYIFGDVFTEVYGYGSSRRAIWIGFMASALLAVLGLFAVWLPPAPEWPNQQAFATVFDFVPHDRRQPDRLLVRRIRQFLRDGENEAAHRRALAVDTHG